MRSIVCVTALTAACSPAGRGNPGVTPDAAVVIDTTPAVCFEPSESGTVMPGSSTLQSCAIWNSVAKMTGSVTLTRDPTMLTMAFATGPVFTGTVVDRSVDLTYWHLHDFSDGCKWRATETLTGDLDPMTCVMTLSYTYVETVEISNGACATPCAGTGTFSLEIMPIP